MIKYAKYILIGVPCILTILLGINIYKYTTYQNNNKVTITSTNNYNKKIEENNNKLKKLNDELTKIKEEKKEKIWEYNRWIKWNQEIKDLIN